MLALHLVKRALLARLRIDEAPESGLAVDLSAGDLGLVLEAGGDYGDLDPVAQFGVERLTGDDQRILGAVCRDEFDDVLVLLECQVVASCKIDQYALGSVDRSVLEKRVADGLLGRAKSMLISPGSVMSSLMPWTPW